MSAGGVCATGDMRAEMNRKFVWGRGATAYGEKKSKGAVPTIAVNLEFEG